jgi:hypothetical protein
MNCTIRYSYVYIMRLYNGDCSDVALEALDSLFQLSNVLSKNVVYNDIQCALQTAIENSLKVWCNFISSRLSLRDDEMF